MSPPLRIVCLGGGYTAMWLTRTLRHAMRRGQVAVTVVDRENFHTFHGFVAEMLVGKVQPGQIVSPARRIFPPARFHNAEVESIDCANRTVTTSRALDGRRYVLPYDHLVLALGSVNDPSRYPGVNEHTLHLKTFADCFHLRNRLLTMLELAEIEEDPRERRRLLTFVVVGGNYAGIEVASELTDFFPRLTRREYPRIRLEEIQVHVVHAGPDILPELARRHPGLALYALRHLSRRGVRIHLQTHLAAATPEEAVLGSGERIATRTIINCAGTAPSPLLDQLPFDRDERGRVRTDRFLRVADREDLWAAGDCAAVPHPHGGLCPSLAIYALTQGRLIGKNILRMRDGKALKGYRFSGLGDACSIGRRRAVAQFKGIPLKGRMAWILWRTVFFYFIPTRDRKVRMLFDWLIWPLVGRDIVNMNVESPPGISQARYEPGQAIIHQGEVGRCLYVILEGEAEVVQNGPTGEVRLARLGRGDHFGEMAVYQRVLRTATIRALTQIQLLKIERDTALHLSDAVGPFGETLRRRPDESSPSEGERRG